MRIFRFKPWMAAAVLITATTAPVAAQRRSAHSLERITNNLDLTDAQRSELRSSMSQTEGRPDLWALASTLQNTLTSEQKGKLLDRGRIAGAYARGVLAGSRAGRAGVRNGRSGARNGRAGARNGRRSQAGQRMAPGNNARTGRATPGRILEDLTEEQKDGLREASEQHRSNLQALREARRDGDVTGEQLREQAQALRESMKEATNAILTDEQQAKLRERRAGAQRRVPSPRGTRQGQENGGQRLGTLRDVGMGEALDLSDAQKETVAIHRALTAGLALRAPAPQARRQQRRSR